ERDEELLLAEFPLYWNNNGLAVLDELMGHQHVVENELRLPIRQRVVRVDRVLRSNDRDNLRFSYPFENGVRPARTALRVHSNGEDAQEGNQTSERPSHASPPRMMQSAHQSNVKSRSMQWRLRGGGRCHLLSTAFLTSAWFSRYARRPSAKARRLKR